MEGGTMKLYLVCIKGFLEIRNKRTKTTIYQFDSKDVEQYVNMKEREIKFSYDSAYCLEECFDYLMRKMELIYIDNFADFKLSKKGLYKYLDGKRIKSWFGTMPAYNYIEQYGGLNEFYPEIAKVFTNY
jgi:hypothetical protein